MRLSLRQRCQALQVGDQLAFRQQMTHRANGNHRDDRLRDKKRTECLLPLDVLAVLTIEVNAFRVATATKRSSYTDRGVDRGNLPHEECSTWAPASK